MSESVDAPRLCRRGNEKGEPFSCSTCGWQGRGEKVRVAQREAHSFFCPQCNDDADMRYLEDGELTEAYPEECPSCPRTDPDDIHVVPCGQVPEAAGVQPEHDLRGTGCWCAPDVAIQPADEARVVIHRAVEVS